MRRRPQPPKHRGSVRRLATALLLALAAGCGAPPGEEGRSGLGVATALGGEPDERFARALEPRAFVFPEDHGPHPDFRTEWWYLTGNLEAEGGRHFGFQVTFFRTALAPDAPERQSAWAADQLYMAHFALTDTAGGRFHHFERFGRGAQGLAGASGEPFRVWLEDWELAASSTDPAASDSPPQVLPPLTVRLATAEAAIDLELEAIKPLVLHGEGGLSRKGPSAGNASYYYSFTRLDTRGQVRLGDTSIAVTGSSWMDREWSTSLLEKDTVGWDWLSLQLDDGSELMVFTLRRANGQPGYASGTLVAADGTARALDGDDFELVPTRRWTSPTSGTAYPAAWRLTLPSEELELTVEPRLADQELSLTFSYWEGAVAAVGRRAARPIGGGGYAELTGYADDGVAPRGGTQG